MSNSSFNGSWIIPLVLDNSFLYTEVAIGDFEKLIKVLTGLRILMELG